MSRLFPTLNPPLPASRLTHPSATTTVVLRNTKKGIIAKIDGSASVTLTAIFEASEVQTPTCFIILPEKVTLTLSDVASKFSKKVNCIGDVLDKAKHCIAVLDNEFGLESSFRASKYIDAVSYIGDVLDNAVCPFFLLLKQYPANAFRTSSSPSLSPLALAYRLWRRS
jgi:hypothetical protein